MLSSSLKQYQLAPLVCTSLCRMCHHIPSVRPQNRHVFVLSLQCIEMRKKGEELRKEKMKRGNCEVLKLFRSKLIDLSAGGIRKG